MEILGEISKLYPNLVSLKLSGNKVKSVQDFSGLKVINSFRVIDIARNPVSEVKDYQRKLRELVPQIDLVDGKDKDGLSVHSDDEDYASSVDGSQQSQRSASEVK